MRKFMFAAALILGAASAAHAAEGNGEPFPVNNGALTQTFASAQLGRDVGSAAYPQFAASLNYRPTGLQVLPTNGSEGIVQTANSLPSAPTIGVQPHSAFAAR